MRYTKWLVVGMSLAWLAGPLPTIAQNTSAFTYSGRLLDNGNPANGAYDLEFTLHSSETNDTPVGNPSTVLRSAVNIVNGLFTTALDFGPDAFTGEVRWLEVRIGPSGAVNLASQSAMTPLVPRQAVRSVPQTTYAQRAMTAVTADTATNAITATRAQVAVTAGTATNAITATRAQVAVTAETATNAITATKAQVAVTASVATNANLLNGLGSDAFAPASGSAAYVAKAGDTMSGLLALPANGLNVGNQLVVTAGKIGIGLSSPTKTLDVRDGLSESGSIHVGGTGANGDPKLITFGDGDFVHIGENAADDRLELKASNFHFTGGNVGIGTASPVSPLHVIGGITTGVDFGSAGAITFLPPDGFAHFHIDNGPAGGRALGVLRFSYGVNPGDFTVISMTQEGRVGVGRIPVANALEVEGAASKSVASAWLANSDRRIKENIRPLTHALEVIGRIRPVAFHYTESYRQAHPCIEDHDYYNVIAQEFAEVFPEAVKESGDKLPNGDSILQVDTYPASIHAIAAIQELNQKIEEQREQNAELKQRLAHLEQLVLNLGTKGE